MAIKLGWSSWPDERFGFRKSGGSRNSPFEAERFGFEIGFIVENPKETYFLCKKDTNMRTN